MRWTLSAACSINFLVNFLFAVLYLHEFVAIKWQLGLATFIFFLGALLFYFLYAKTDEEYSERLKSLEKLFETDEYKSFCDKST